MATFVPAFFAQNLEIYQKTLDGETFSNRDETFTQKDIDEPYHRCQLVFIKPGSLEQEP